MGIHRNSQKRIYREGTIYFVTTKTHWGYPYFKEDILCELLIDEIHLCRLIHPFNLFGYKINPGHVHILFQPNGSSDYSTIMHFLKRNSARNINRMMFASSHEGEDFRVHREGEDFRVHREGEDDHPRLHGANSRIQSQLTFFDTTIDHYRMQFHSKHGINHSFPKFKWQSSFHDHIIRDDVDFFNHVNYIKRQWIKHGLGKNKWCYVDSRVDGDYYNECG